MVRFIINDVETAELQGFLASPAQIAPAWVKPEGLEPTLAIHDTVHEMAKDEARHGKAFAGLLKRCFNK